MGRFASPWTRALFCLRALLLPIIAVAMAGCTLIGAELNNRGGWIDSKLDDHWMIADTKQMRVLRAYVLIGSLTRMAQTKYESERENIVHHVNSAIRVASDAFYCAYSQPGRCIYFDERMTEMEVAILRLLVAVVSHKEDEDLLEGLGKQLSDTFPLLKGFDSVTKMIDALTSTGELAVNAAKVVQSVLKFGKVAYFKGRRLGALYRDSIELQMLTVIHSLDSMCAIKYGRFLSYNTKEYSYDPPRELAPYEQWAISNFYGEPAELRDACPAFKVGLQLWNRGAGSLIEWRDFLNNEAVLFRDKIIPTDESFIQASDLIWRACAHLTKDLDERSECIGRRRLKGNTPAAECAFGDDDLYAVEKASEIKAEREKQKKGAEKANSLTRGGTAKVPKTVAKHYLDQCRLILYAEVVERRVDRRERSGARITWLSRLSPSASHPPSYHAAYQIGR